MDKKCGNCEHFVKHYVFSSKRFSEIEHGHCTYPMLKNRQTTHKACQHFIEKDKSKEEKIIEIDIRINERILQKLMFRTRKGKVN